MTWFQADVLTAAAVAAVILLFRAVAHLETLIKLTAKTHLYLADISHRQMRMQHIAQGWVDPPGALVEHIGEGWVDPGAD